MKELKRNSDADYLADYLIKGSQNFAIKDFLDFLRNNVSGDFPNAVVHIDHWFLYSFKKFESGSTKSYNWLEDPLYRLQEDENKIMTNNRGCTVFRHFLIPHPRYFKNKVNINVYRKLIISVLHVQLCMANMVFIHFINPKVLSGINTERILETTVLPLLGFASIAQGFHIGECQKLEIISSLKLKDITEEIKNIISKEDSQHFLAYYDERNEHGAFKRSNVLRQAKPWKRGCAGIYI